MSAASGTFTSRDLESAASETFSIEETETREIESFAVSLIASTRLQARSACNSKLRRSFERAGALW